MSKLEQKLGVLLHIFTLSLLTIVWMKSVHTLIFKGLYSTFFVYINFHSWTMFTLTSSFLYTYYILSYIKPLARLVITLSFSVLAIQWYDFVWSVCSQLVRGKGLSYFSVLICVILANMLIKLNKKYDFLIQFRHTSSIGRINIILAIFAFTLAFTALSGSGFYEAVELSDLGIGPDPNAGNDMWIISKLIGFVLWLTFIEDDNRFRESAPLILSPELF